DDSVSPGREEGGAAREESWQLPRFRGGRFARRGTAQAGRRSACAVRREHATCYGAFDRVGKTYARRRERRRETSAEARQKGQVEMSVNTLSEICRAIAPAVGNPLWQWTMFAA